jgi:hypothetical protein
MNEREHLSQPTVTITNDFFSFSQNRAQPPNTRKTLGKIINQDHPSFRDISIDMNISKKLTPFASKQTIMGQSHEEPNSISGILGNLSALLVQEGVGSSRAIMEEIDELLII